jgi:NADH:ubiquinone oxidoreductase subunit H
VSEALPIPFIQFLQVATITAAAPGISGVIARVEARMQGRRGPRVLQPYYDLAKLFRKEALAPEGASWVFLAAPLAAMTCYLTVPLLIPVLTTYGLPLGYMGDILGGGFILSLASFVVAVAALETGSPYAQLGASRAKTFGAITEPVVLFVVFTVALITGTAVNTARSLRPQLPPRRDPPPRSKTAAALIIARHGAHEPGRGPAGPAERGLRPDPRAPRPDGDRWRDACV